MGVKIFLPFIGVYENYGRNDEINSEVTVMTMIDHIKNRRSVRDFKSDEIPAESLRTILEAVQHSQSWANNQCWEIIVLTDPVVKKAVQDALPQGNPSFNAIEKAPVVLALCARLEVSGYYQGVTPTKFGDWFMFDLGIVTQNICLTAYDLGLGTVVVGLFDHAKAARILSLPPKHELVALVPIGIPVPDAAVRDSPRKDMEEFIHYNGF
ncbi:MAG: nitroreductase [Deltaproteobacteria bacterium]|jgi:nitroreductase|nr:nitroreductase [Deltaproteobacteria bacterium]